jgi:hypothetical protein
MISVPLAFAILSTLPPQAGAAARAGDTACVALLLPAVEGVDDATSVAMSVRSIFQSYLTGPSLKSVPLDARLASQANEEARQKDCTKILTVTVNRKPAGNGGSKLGTVARAAGTTAAYIPAPNYGSAVAMGAAVGSAEAVAGVASNTRAKDEMTLGYKVVTADGATVLAERSDKAKAKSNGEDLLTPLIAKASEVVAGAVTRK